MALVTFDDNTTNTVNSTAAIGTPKSLAVFGAGQLTALAGAGLCSVGTIGVAAAGTAVAIPLGVIGAPLALAGVIICGLAGDIASSNNDENTTVNVELDEIYNSLLADNVSSNVLPTFMPAWTTAAWDLL